MSGALPRGTVTFLFSDIEGSTDLVRRVGGETFVAIRADHRRLLRDAFAAHDGREIETAGDGFFVVFDTARAAVSAAVAAQRALAAFSWPEHAAVRVRIGLHTAEPHLGEDGYVGVGVHRASRICDAAGGGQILVSNATAGIVEDAEPPGVELVDLGEYQLKGLPRRQRLFQLTVKGLHTEFDPSRTADGVPARPGVGTFLLSDLSGWRHVIRAVGDEASGALAADYHSSVTASVEAEDGIVLERAADNVLAVFRSAGSAARAAVAVRAALSDFAWPPECDVDIAILLHSGRWSGDPRRVDAGTALYRAFQLARMVEPGQVLVSQTTAALLEGERDAPALRSLGERVIPDHDEPQRFYEVVGPA
jgi:class 3 adenylate cyclase